MIASTDLVEDQVRVIQKLSRIVREILQTVPDSRKAELRFVRDLFLLSYPVPNESPTLSLLELPCNIFRKSFGRHAARKCHQDVDSFVLSEGILQHILRHHGAFPAASLAANACNFVCVD